MDEVWELQTDVSKPILSLWSVLLFHEKFSIAEKSYLEMEQSCKRSDPNPKPFRKILSTVVE